MHVDERVLADFLIDSGLISRGTLADARSRASEQGETFYDALLSGGFVSGDHLRRAAAHTLGVPFVMLEESDIAPEALVLIPEPLSRTHNIVAFRVHDTTLEVALLNLDDLKLLESLPVATSYKLAPRLTTQHSIKKALLGYQKHLKEKFGSFAQHGFHVVEGLIKHAIYSRAGGVHIEPSTTGFLIRYRIGEMLHEAMQLPEHVGKLLVDQLKAAAKLFPVASAQEGHFTIEHDNETHTVHLSTMPIHKGEKLVLRLAKQDVHAKIGSLESRGFHGEALEALHKALALRSGLILVASEDAKHLQSLLYTLLATAAHPYRALASVEEGVTLHLPHVAQGSTTVSKLSYATLLRTTLKHDPDVVMVSRVDETEVALLVSEAASNGKLIIAGIEAPSAGRAIEKMRNFGVSPLLLASVVKVAVASTILRKLCPHCRSTHRLSRAEGAILEERADFGRVFTALKEEGVIDRAASWKELDFYWPEGCSKCEGGYMGGVGVGEALPISQVQKELILREMSGEDMANQARVEGGLNLPEDALFKAARGDTSLEEVVALVKRPN